jgi:hypothetical protein
LSKTAAMARIIHPPNGRGAGPSGCYHPRS